MSRRFNRLSSVTGSLILLIAGSGTANAGLLGSLLGGSSEDSTTQTEEPAAPDSYNSKGTFSEPFAEPTIIVDGEAVETDEKCITRADGMDECKPAAGTMALLKDGRLLYLNALEGTENVELSIVAEFGEVSVNDQTRVLSLDENDNPSWIKPSPLDAGANPDGNDSETLLNGTELDGLLDTADNTSANDGALFCSDVIGLANGDVMAVGGTDYYSEPGIDGLPLGVAELEGIKNSRIFDEETNTWRQSGDMTYGRWYPSLVTMGNGNVFVASGVTKLLKPVYPDEPLNSGRNVVQTETYDPCAGAWTQNPSTADRSLPLYPRMHLLPNGHIFYNAGGQAFNPFGQGYDQALWNIVASFNPDTQRWNDIGYAGLPLRLDEAGLGQLSSTLNITNLSLDQVGSLLGDVLDSPTDLLTSAADLGVSEEDLRMAIAGGMRGSTSSTMLPLKPDASGNYNEVELLTAGGVPSYAVLTNPGGYLPTDQDLLRLSVRTTGVAAEAIEVVGSLCNAWIGVGGRELHIGGQAAHQLSPTGPQLRGDAGRVDCQRSRPKCVLNLIHSLLPCCAHSRWGCNRKEVSAAIEQIGPGSDPHKRRAQCFGQIASQPARKFGIRHEYERKAVRHTHVVGTGWMASTVMLSSLPASIASLARRAT